MAHRVMKLNFLLPLKYFQRKFSCSAVVCNYLYRNENFFDQYLKKIQHDPMYAEKVIFASAINKKNITFSKLLCTSIEEFRAREQAKEHEYQKLEAEKDKKSKNEEENQKNQKVSDIRLEILNSALHFVPEYGWSVEAITKGAEKAGYPGVAHGLIPNGGTELIYHFYGKCNNELVEYLKEETKNGQIIPKEASEFIVQAVKYRLEMLIPYEKQWPQALAKMTLPQNAQQSLAQLLTMIDDICYFAGDRSVDYGWYVRRIGMSTIYKLTELYMLQDKSENHKATWEFLKNRMNEAQVVDVIFGQSGEPSQKTKNRLNAIFETARNIIGMNYDRRVQL